MAVRTACQTQKSSAPGRVWVRCLAFESDTALRPRRRRCCSRLSNVGDNTVILRCAHVEKCKNIACRELKSANGTCGRTRGGDTGYTLPWPQPCSRAPQYGSTASMDSCGSCNGPCRRRQCPYVTDACPALAVEARQCGGPAVSTRARHPATSRQLMSLFCVANVVQKTGHKCQARNYKTRRRRRRQRGRHDGATPSRSS